MDIEEDSAQVKVPPPLILLLHLIIATVVNYFIPISIVSNQLRVILASTTFFLGVGVMVYCAMIFKHKETNIEPWKQTNTIIVTGIYKFSRNPIYLSFLIIALGYGFALNSAWPIISLISFVPILQKYVIGKEEKYLESKFGESYRIYKTNTRRWI